MVSTRGTKFKFIEGERVLCYEPDPTKAKVLYESKVLELVTTKDGKGRKIPEYLIHFNGWSNSWDRCVTEEFVLKDNEENRVLQKRLAEAAALNLIHPIRKKSKKKKRRLSDLLRESFGGKNRRRTWGGPLTDEEIGGIADEFRSAEAGGRANCLSNPDESNASPSSCSSTAENSEDDDEECSAMELEFPDVLKKKLEDGHRLIKQEGKFIQLPCSPNVIAIMEGYVRNYMANALCVTPEKTKAGRNQNSIPDKNVNLCKEVMDGLRIYFDFTLPTMLLYDEERPQYAYFLDNYKPPTEIIPRKASPSDVSPPVLIKEGRLTVDPPLDMYNEAPQLSSLSTTPQKSSKREIAEETIEIGFPVRVLRSTASRLEAKSHANMTQCKQFDHAESDRPMSSRSNQIKATKCGRYHQQNSANKSLSSSSMTVSRTRANSPPPSPSSSNASVPPRLIPESPLLTPKKQSPPPLLAIANSTQSNCPQSSSVGVGHRRSSRAELSDALNESLSWEMIPPSVYLQMPPPPSLIYGAQHFLRLFVKLPEMLTRTDIADYKLNAIHSHLELFLKYMVDCQDELFVNTEVVSTFGPTKTDENIHILL